MKIWIMGTNLQCLTKQCKNISEHSEKATVKNRGRRMRALQSNLDVATVRVVVSTVE